jgi:hypothetical protein
MSLHRSIVTMVVPGDVVPGASAQPMPWPVVAALVLGWALVLLFVLARRARRR